MRKTVNQKAWFFVLPVVAAGGVQRHHPADDGGQLFGPGDLRRQRLLLGRRALVRGGAALRAASTPRCCASSSSPAIILVIEIPLGLAIALTMPRKGPWVSVCLVLMALPLLIPVERRRRHVEHLGAARHRPARPRASTRSASTTTTPASRSPPGSPSSSWMSGTGRRWSCCSAMPASSRSPTPITRRPRSTAARPWAVFRYIQLPKLQAMC